MPMLEEERKYEVSGGFVLPDLSPCVPDGGRLIVRPAQKLKATYYDTPDLRLARSGASLRYRRGDDEPWTVKLPTEYGQHPQRDLGGRPGEHTARAPARSRDRLHPRSHRSRR